MSDGHSRAGNSVRRSTGTSCSAVASSPGPKVAPGTFTTLTGTRPFAYRDATIMFCEDTSLDADAVRQV